MSQNIFFTAFNDHPQPSLTDEKPERPTTVRLLSFQPDMEGITADFDKDASISSITDVEYHNDTGGRSYCEVRQETITKLSDLYGQFTTKTLENQEESTLTSDRSVCLFQEWLLSFISNAQFSYPMKCHFVALMVAECFDHVNTTYGGLTKDQASIVRALPNH